MRNPVWLLVFYLAFYSYIGGIYDIWDDTSEALYIVDANRMSFTELATTQCVGMIPWCLRIFIAYVTDRYSLLGLGHRRPYTALGVIFAGTACMLLREVALPGGFGAYVLLMIVRNVGVALSDSATDGMSVDADNNDISGKISAWSGVGRTLGQMVTAAIAGQLLTEGSYTRPGEAGGNDEVIFIVGSFHKFLLVLAIISFAFVPFNFILLEERVDAATAAKEARAKLLAAERASGIVKVDNPVGPMSQAPLSPALGRNVSSTDLGSADSRSVARPLPPLAFESVSIDEESGIEMRATTGVPTRAERTRKLQEATVEVVPPVDAAPNPMREASGVEDFGSRKMKRRGSLARLVDAAESARKALPKMVTRTRVGAPVFPRTVEADAPPPKKGRRFSFANLSSFFGASMDAEASTARLTVDIPASPAEPKRVSPPTSSLTISAPGTPSTAVSVDGVPLPPRRRRSFSEAAQESWRYFYADVTKIWEFVCSIRVATLLAFVFLSNYGANMATFPTANWMSDKFGLKADTINYLYMVGNAGGMIASVVWGYAFDMLGPNTKVLSMSVVAACLGASYCLLLLAQNELHLYFLSFCYVGWWGALFCVQTAMARILADRNLSATAFGIVLGVMNISAVTGTFTGGPVSDNLGVEYTFLIGGACCIGAALLPPIILIPSAFWRAIGCAVRETPTDDPSPKEASAEITKILEA